MRIPRFLCRSEASKKPSTFRRVLRLSPSRQRVLRRPVEPAANSGHLFDDLVGPRQQAIRRLYAEYLGRLEVDDKLEFGRVLDRQIARLFALEYAVHIVRGLPVQLMLSMP